MLRVCRGVFSKFQRSFFDRAIQSPSLHPAAKKINLAAPALRTIECTDLAHTASGISNKIDSMGHPLQSCEGYSFNVPQQIIDQIFVVNSTSSLHFLAFKRTKLATPKHISSAFHQKRYQKSIHATSSLPTLLSNPSPSFVKVKHMRRKSYIKLKMADWK